MEVKFTTQEELYWKDIHSKVITDDRIAEGQSYGLPRPGHAEGSVANHVAEIFENLKKLRPILSEEEYWKLMVLITVHDSFKLEGKRQTNGKDVALAHPSSHASLARKFLAEYTDDEQMLAIVQYHDEGHALWTGWKKKGRINEMRLARALAAVMGLRQECPWNGEVDLYILFTIIDGATKSKLQDRSPKWFVDLVDKYIKVPRGYQALEMLGIEE